MSFWKKKSPHLIEASRKLAEQGVYPVSHSSTSATTSFSTSNSGSAVNDVNSVERRYGAVRSALSAGTVIEGRLSFDIPVRIDGKLKGEVYSTQPVIVGPSAAITATIVAPVIVIFGNVKGTVTAREKVELQQGAQLEADVSTPAFIVTEGSVFNGKLVS